MCHPYSHPTGGLSPRVRGNLGLGVSQDVRERSIPACAGEPLRRVPLPPPVEVYPRVCGGTEWSPNTTSAIDGLSPRVRGNQRERARRRFRVRSIPACAGEPVPSALRRRRCWVYPRVCGGTAEDGRIHNWPGGLSPRVRGNRGRRGWPAPHTRSIPACAGEPIRDHRNGEPRRVYPRVCGGTVMASAISATVVGLSPRVRGNPPQGIAPYPRDGSIPACAGEPAPSSAPRSPGSVYPRVCGGTREPEDAVDVLIGLSPRVRGNHTPAPSAPNCRRSIPACAGEPCRSRTPPEPSAVYPRVCGGTAVILAMTAIVWGLSPRVRGNRLYGCLETRGRRSIPACAGEPVSRSICPPNTGVYPRVCGGTICANWNSSNPAGLSPRVRGTSGSSVRSRTVKGLSPRVRGNRDALPRC